MNYFELFEIPVSLRVDKKALRQKYLTLSRRFHPDHNSTENEAAQDHVLEQSAALNKAYQTLSDEEALLAYVLRQKGLLETDEKYALPSHFLMEMMELNEALEEVADANGKAAFFDSLKNKEADIYAPVKETLETYQDGVTSEEALLQVKDYYFKKKYLGRLAQQLEQML